MDGQTKASLKVIVSLLKAKAEDHRITAKLWETNLDAYGSTSEGAAEWKGQGEGLATAATILENFLKECQ